MISKVVYSYLSSFEVITLMGPPRKAGFVQIQFYVVVAVVWTADC